MAMEESFCSPTHKLFVSRVQDDEHKRRELNATHWWVEMHSKVYAKGFTKIEYRRALAYRCYNRQGGGERME